MKISVVKSLQEHKTEDNLCTYKTGISEVVFIYCI